MTHVMPYRRKRQGRTDYKKRLVLLKSGLPRLVIRASNKSIQAQLVLYSEDGDKVLVTTRATDLKKLGWKGATGNLPAAYLTGLLLASKADVSQDVILDIGLQKHHKGGRLYAVAKGALDGGLAIRCSEEAFPPEDRLTGAHINEGLPAQVAQLKTKITK